MSKKTDINFDKLNKFDLFFDFIGKNKIYLLILFFLLIMVSFVRIAKVDFVNDISVMLPDSPELKRSLDFINNSDMSDTIAFSITCKNNSNKNLLSQTEAFSDKLKKVSLITEVVTGIENLDISKLRRDITKLLPLLLAKEDYKLFKDIEKDEYIAEKARQLFIMLTTPGSSFMQTSMDTDPFGWSNHILNKLQVLSKSMGFDVELKNKHFVDKTHQYSLAIAKTSAPLTDAEKSEILMSAINDIIKTFPDLNIVTVCGHKHTLSNQKIVKKDIYITTIIITLSFIVLMLFMFKTFDALSIFILPFFAIVLSVFISSFILNSLSFFMIGFAAVIAGISVDYGIHLFTAWKTNGYKGLKNTIKPVWIASLSTMGVFVSFFISSVQGYKELAVFSIISIVICVLLSIIFLPHFWKKKSLIPNINIPAEVSVNKSKFILILWGVIFFFSIMSMINSDFLKATDISAFDGSEQSVFDSESQFYGVWGGEKKPGVIVTKGKNIEDAWPDYELITNKLKNNIDGFNSLAVLLPSIKQQQKNLQNFQEFWTKDKIFQLKDKFLKETEAYGFKKDSFNKFFLLLESKGLSFENQIPEVLQIFEKHFVKEIDSTHLLSYFNDTKENFTKIESVLTDYPDSYIVSRIELSSHIGKQLILDLKKISFFAFCWVCVLIIIFLRKPKDIFLSLLPVVTSISFVFLALNLLSIEVSAIILITLIIILGLSLDYGVFISSADSLKNRKSVIIAATFSMLTSMMGAGALLFASHPVMFSIGVTLVSGIIAAYLSAVFCIPAFKKVLK
ncbi:MULTISPECIES: MMPL family transporter [Desulfobacula]|uniref:Exporter-like protein n=1 Tax=Desulfobacula toluolica (strain DSM 7467 / Tol2) TaxID=651182 RepID=K0NMY9_DESTT|nr:MULTISPECIES: exporter-like protein [Desulfobacula]CCK81995.1 exporter-like protein [Desulfobacula toluolica Tol2]